MPGKLSAELRKEFPGARGYSVQNLWYMRQFYNEYHQSEFLQPMVGEISWNKNIIIMSKCKDDLQREFYLRMTKKYGWTKNVLLHQIENQATYTITLKLPKDYIGLLPSPKDIQEKLKELK